MEKIIKNLIEIENRYLPILEILEEKSIYKGLYKGFITIQSKLNYNPEILFLGINPGDGAFVEAVNEKKGLPKRILSNTDYYSLDWLKKGTCRAESKEKKWVKYNWFEKTKKINNSFPVRMIELLESFAKKTNINKPFNEKELVDVIENEIQNKIVYTNICPIATTSIKELNQILNLLSKEKDIDRIIGSNVKTTPSILKNFFRQRTIDLINEINPKVIVLLGYTAYQDLTLLNDYKGEKVIKRQIKLRKNDQTKYKIISFSRQGNWSPLIDNITKAIIE